MRKFLILFFISAMHSLEVSELLQVEIKGSIALKNGWSLNRAEKVIEYLTNHPTLSFTAALGSGTFGVVFEAERIDKDTEEVHKKAFKLQFDDINFSAVNDLMYTYDKVKSTDPESYIIQMEKPYKKIEVISEIRRGLAGIEMELGQPGDQKYFTDLSQDGKIANVKNLYNFMIMLMKGFRYMNQVKGFYHADVKPANWVVIHDPVDGHIEPRIIDFDLIFKHPRLTCAEKGIEYYQAIEELLPEEHQEKNKFGKYIKTLDYLAVQKNREIEDRNIELRKQQKSCNPSWLAYTIDYRAPELKSIVRENNFDDREYINANQKYEWIRRRWSSRFIEECWAIGQSMSETISKNIVQIKTSSKEYTLMKEVVDMLRHSDPAERKTLDYAIKYLEDNKPQEQRLI